MTNSTILGVAVCIVGLAVILLLCSLIVRGLREWAYQREQERRYADAWQAANRARRHDDRHDHYDEARPE
jgi:hypothetical protein